jgi:pimeloyl-ACP methyl ester carboxylesterase
MHPTSPNLRRAYVDYRQGQLHYYDGGGSGTPLLLLHQSPVSSSDWFAIVPHLSAAGLRVLAMDTPGMGLSDPLAPAPTLEDYADAVPALLDHAGLSHVDVLGHHTGAQIAIEAAVRHPQRIRRVALYGAPVMTAEERQGFWERIVPREREGRVHRPQPGGANLTEQFLRIEAVFGTVAAQRMLLSALLAGPLWWHGHNAALRHDMTPALLAARQPLLLITHVGEFLDANTRAGARLRPDARLVELPESANMAMDDAPAALAAAVVDFVLAPDP